jgi:hypothetical protein
LKRKGDWRQSAPSLLTIPARHQKGLRPVDLYGFFHPSLPLDHQQAFQAVDSQGI